jgi:hypothetical protein
MCGSVTAFTEVANHQRKSKPKEALGALGVVAEHKM